MPRVSPALRVLSRVPSSVGVRSSVRAPLATLPRLMPTLSLMRLMLLPVAGAAVSIVKRRGLDATPRLPAASATRAVKE